MRTILYILRMEWPGKFVYNDTYQLQETENGWVSTNETTNSRFLNRPSVSISDFEDSIRNMGYFIVERMDVS